MTKIEIGDAYLVIPVLCATPGANTAAVVLALGLITGVVPEFK